MKKEKKAKPVKAVKQKAPKKKRKNLLKNISWKHLQTQINGYGYEYSLKKYLIRVLIALVALVAVSAIFQLNLLNIIILIVIAIFAYPVIILAQFNYMANNDSFEQLVAYMDQMILSFKKNPKILYAMENTLEIADGKMKDCLVRAIRVIKTDVSSVNVYEKAFRIIEKEYNCSRLKTLHRFMLTVEKENSVSYQESIDNLYFDIRSWVTRTYKYQGALAATKSKIVIILALSIGISALFAHLLSSVEDQMRDTYDFVILSQPLYQIATTIYLIAFILIYTLMNTKINGYWLVNDISDKNDSYVAKCYEYVINYDPKMAAKHSMIAAFFGVPFIVVGIVLGSKIVILLGVAISIIMFLKGQMSYKSKKKAVERALLKEFPIWLRDLAINLNNKVVVRAIEESTKTASSVLQPFLRGFLAAVEKNPTSIYPYINFFGDFKVSELATAAKMLYSVQELSAEDSQRQINDLIVRNQALLEEAEKMKHDDSIAGVTFISVLPMVLMAFKLMIDLGVMMGQFLALASSAY